MLSPEAGRAAFGWGLLIVLGAVGLLVVLSPGTPEFAVTLLTLLIGLIFIVMVAVLVRLAGR
jgi:uncharacterized membrane protein HdeD (DUF308 family)